MPKLLPLLALKSLEIFNIIYDDNRISIEGDTHNAFTEDVAARYRAYGWHVIEVAALATDGTCDLVSLDAAMVAAKKETSKPTLIRMHSVIAWPAPKAQGTAASHGSALGVEEIKATKIALGLNPDEALSQCLQMFWHMLDLLKDRGASARATWDARVCNMEDQLILKKLQCLKDCVLKRLPAGWDSEIPVFSPDKEVATRAASGEVINAIAAKLPEFWGGSADLAGSNNTSIKGSGSFLADIIFY